MPDLTTPEPPSHAARHAVLGLMAEYPDFPHAGILFRDLTPVFADATAFRAVIDELAANVRASGATAVAGVEARGFLLASAVAYATGVGVLALRKAGKLPGEVLSEQYDLEYGSASLELHAGEADAASRVLLVDDLLATGGTLSAASLLLERAGHEVVEIAVVVELSALGGAATLAPLQVRSIVQV